MSSRRNNLGLLAKVNFPLYTLQMLTSRHILVGGGGGSSKTGVANGFEIFELSHDGIQFVAEEVTRYETGSSVVMNCASHSNTKKSWIVAGQEGHCQLYAVTSKIVAAENSAPKDGVKQRKKNDGSKNHERIEKIEETSKCKKLQLLIKPSDTVQTDFGKEESLQRVVRISPNGKFMATGGTDGHIRLWTFPNLTTIHDMPGHEKEIDDIDFSPDGQLLATVAKDGRAILWKVSTGTKDKELTWNSAGGKYLYKRCRFKCSKEEKSQQLFALSNAVVGKNSSFLQLWDTDQAVLSKSLAYNETLSALAVSDDGKFVAVGTMFSGSVDILIAFSLQRVLRVPGVHSMFVTGLEFLPTKLDGPAVTSNSEAAVVSISVDNKICIHRIPFRHTVPFWLAIILIVISICGAFIFCSYLGI